MSSFDHTTSRHRIETTDSYYDIRLAVQRYIEDHVGESITLPSFVRAKGGSQRQVQRALSWYDTNWRKMVLDERMKRARELLSNTRDPVNAVATAVGYSPSQFSRTFKAEEGSTPEEYRQFRQSQR